MAYSAGSGGPPPATTAGQSSNQSSTSQTSNQSSTSQTNQSNQTSQSPYQSAVGLDIRSRLQTIIDGKKNRLPVALNNGITTILSNSVRAVKNLVTKRNQFYDSKSKMVKPGTDYHVHYTSQLTEHFMTGTEHNLTSELIYPFVNDVTDFNYYNTLNRQGKLKIKSKVKTPTEEDYKAKQFTRYFAKQANDKSQPAFEVSSVDANSSPLYNYTTVDWLITGNRDNVYKKNIQQIELASNAIAGIDKILSPFQFYRYIDESSDADALRRKLGMIDLSGYNTTTQSDGFGTNTGGGSAGTCSLGSQYTTQEACEAAGGNWTDANPSGFDAGGNEIEEPKMC